MSLRSRLLAMIILATLIPAALMSARSFQNRSNEIEMASIELSRAAQDIANDLDSKILGTAQLLYGLARARDLDSRNKLTCSSFLAAVRKENPQYTGILTIDPDGNMFCDSWVSGRALDLRDRAYFKKAMVDKDAIALEPVFGRLTGISVLQIAYPVRAETDQLKFVLLASFNLQSFAEYHNKRLPQAMAIVIVDGSGKVLVQPADGDWFKPAGPTIASSGLFQFAVSHSNAKAGEVAGDDHRTQVWAVSNLLAPHDAGIFFMVGRSRDDLVAVANRNLIHDLTILAAVSLLLFVGVWTWAELGVRRQVMRVAAMATQLGLGDLNARISPPYPSGELGGLMTVLNSTAESLEHQRTSIEDLHETLRQSQKMEALGQLTGGIAHDFNNLLTVIQGNSELLVEQLNDNSDLCAMAEMTLSASRRAAELTRGLLAFSRRQPLDPHVIDVNDLIAGMMPLLHRTLGRDIEIEFSKGVDLWRSLVDPAQLESALLNLCVNARDAMDNGGRLSIQTANTQLDQDEGFPTDLLPGRYVIIIVSDTGSGISPENLDHVFDPFFTTKDISKGTGLGLSMVYGFIKQSQGQIKIYSELGKGTAIKLFLPMSIDAIVHAADEENVSLAELGGSERILVVEDDVLVRSHVERQLVKLGYSVKVAADGPKALAIIKRDPDIDLLFTDVVMPGGLNGHMLALKSVKIRPHLKVLYTSGFTENALLFNNRLKGDVILLSKPYSRIELAKKIRAALNAQNNKDASLDV
jgi:signal transduction histidine kinase/ActR/RegA family two-component response regulator